MMIYRSSTWISDPNTALRELPVAPRSHDEITDLLIGFGELEAAVADRICESEDGDSPLSAALRRVAHALGRAFCASMQGDRDRASAWIARSGLEDLRAESLPSSAQFSAPEGYAYYALYPEQYVRAANRFFDEEHPDTVVAIGIRSIGTSLSAVIAGALEERGARVCSLTVRPRGHPFARELKIAPGLKRNLAGLAGAWFLVIDEGPGLSGSSFAATAGALSQLGVADERIVLFPSWAPDGNCFVSVEARDRWRRHRKVCVSFEECFPEFAGYTDLSGGQWREVLGCCPDLAVQPQHERRKYLDREQRHLLKFAGLGRYGHAALERARRFADAGLTPAPCALQSGFLISRFQPGMPLDGPGDGRVMEPVCRYLAAVRRETVAAPGTPFDELLEMIRINGGGCVPETRLRTFGRAVSDSQPVAIDGRMLPHEWIESGLSFIKTDGLDHHANHFLPGCQDIAWDLAGTITEFGLDRGQSEQLIARYEALSGDRGTAARFPFYRVASVY
jgi:hypothetical protein